MRRMPWLTHRRSAARFLATLVLGALCAGACDGKGVTFDDDYECVERPDDPTGYLQPICEYIAANMDSYPMDPNQLEIEGITPGDEQTRFNVPEYSSAQFDFVALSCCYTGDWAVIDVTTKQVVAFFLGDV